MQTPVPPLKACLLEAEPQRQSLEEMTGVTSSDALYRGYRALRDIGIQVVYTTLYLKGRDALHTFQLAEENDAALGRLRLLEALMALNRACGGQRDAWALFACTDSAADSRSIVGFRTAPATAVRDLD